MQLAVISTSRYILKPETNHGYHHLFPLRSNFLVCKDSQLECNSLTRTIGLCFSYRTHRLRFLHCVTTVHSGMFSDLLRVVVNFSSSATAAFISLFFFFFLTKQKRESAHTLSNIHLFQEQNGKLLAMDK